MAQITVPLADLETPQASTPRPSMTFAIVNGQRVPVDDAPATLTVPLGELQSTPAPADDDNSFVKHYVDQINPLPLGQLLPFPKMLGGGGMPVPKAVGGSGLDAGIPSAISNLLKSQGHVFDEGVEAWKRGNHAEAAAHMLYWLLPVIGPVLDKAGNEMQSGKWRAGLGDTFGLSTALFGPEAIARATPRPGMGTTTAPPPPRLSPEELAGNALADARGVPLSAADRTGSRAVRGVQKIAGESFLGEGPAERFRQAQTGALDRVGGQLADQVRPGAVSPEDAGAGSRQAITNTIESLKGAADVAYKRAREIEAMPEHEETVHTAPHGTPAYRKILDKLRGGLTGEGGIKIKLDPTEPELYTMRQIETELDASQYQRGKLVRDSYDYSDHHYARGSSNADVYHDIQQAAGTDSISGREMVAGIRQTLETGEWNAASYAAYKVAQQRVRAAGGTIGPGPRLAEEAPILGRAERVPLPVDVTKAQELLEGLHDELQRANELTPLQGDLAGAYRAVDRLMTAPGKVSLSIADSARSELLKLARTDDPLFRSRGQGVASRAAEALDQAIQAKADAVPELQSALEQGRSATRAKYQVGSVLDELPAEAVKAFDKLTAPRDGNIDLLRRTQEAAPEKMPDLGRAKLQQWLDLASERGRFDHADRLYAEWQKLGPQTKRILFGDPTLIDELDRFFLLAKRIAENPNPSGTAGTLTKIGEITGPISAVAAWHPMIALGSIATSIGMGGLARLLYSAKGARAVGEFLQSSTLPATASRGVAGVTRGASRAAALARLAEVAKAEGVDFPRAADRDDQR